jgi:hypothetical protein
MRKSNMIRVRRRRLSLPQKIRRIKEDQMEAVITYIMPDGSQMSETLSERFMQGKKVGEIITDLYAITHDRGASTFKI